MSETRAKRDEQDARRRLNEEMIAWRHVRLPELAADLPYPVTKAERLGPPQPTPQTCPSCGLEADDQPAGGFCDNPFHQPTQDPK